MSNNLAAYRQLLLARTLHPSGIKTNGQPGLANYNQTVNLDSRCVVAQVGLMGLRRELGCEQPPRLVPPHMYDRAMRIMALDDTCFAAHLRAANVRLYYDWDWEGTIQEYDRIIATWPDDHLERSIHFRALGRTNEARFHHEQMKRLSHPSFYEAIFIRVRGPFRFRRSAHRQSLGPWDGLRDDPRFEALCQKVGMGKDQWPK